MMRGAVAGMLSREFAGRSEAAVFLRLQQRQAEERKRRERDDDLDQDEAEFVDFAMSVLSVSEASEFRLELTTYDTATVAALQQNGIELEQAREEVRTLLTKAHVLPDGRRVFKTEDGLRVFDEHGHELDASTVEPDEIFDWRPRWETFDAARGHVIALEEERAAIADYQAKLDAARERLDSGEMTRGELDELREELKAEMPEAVRAQIPELADGPAAVAKGQASDVDLALDISDDMVPTAPAMRAFVPG